MNIREAFMFSSAIISAILVVLAVLFIPPLTGEYEPIASVLLFGFALILLFFAWRRIDFTYGNFKRFKFNKVPENLARSFIVAALFYFALSLLLSAFELKLYGRAIASVFFLFFLTYVIIAYLWHKFFTPYKVWKLILPKFVRKLRNKHLTERDVKDLRQLIDELFEKFPGKEDEPIWLAKKDAISETLDMLEDILEDFDYCLASGNEIHRKEALSKFSIFMKNLLVKAGPEFHVYHSREHVLQNEGLFDDLIKQIDKLKDLKKFETRELSFKQKMRRWRRDFEKLESSISWTFPWLARFFGVVLIIFSIGLPILSPTTDFRIIALFLLVGISLVSEKFIDKIFKAYELARRNLSP